MEEENVLTGNKLIAEFMNLGIQLHMVEHPISGEYIDIEDLEYHESWDWLMPVVDNIDSIEVNGDTFAIDMFQTGCQVFRYSMYNGEIITTEGVNRLDATYKAVIEFIKWYNKNKDESST